MPLFRTAPSSSLKDSIRRLVASGSDRLGPMAEIQADQMAADVAHKRSLVDKVRQEVELAKEKAAVEAETLRRRRDPQLRTEYAALASGVDLPDALRIVGAWRGDMEQPSTADYDDADMVGRQAQPFRMQAPPNVSDNQSRLFKNALASVYGTDIATGKTNAAQLAAAGGQLQEQGLIDQAASAPDAQTGNRIVAAVHGRIRNPFATGAQGQVINRETGAVDEGTNLASATRDRLVAQAATEAARQTELGTRSTRNTAAAGLANERAGAVRRGETARGGKIVSPEQVERWVNDIARKEWEAYSPSQRKGMNYEQHLSKVRERFKGQAGAAGIEQDTKDALEAINRGAPARAVRERFKQRWGVELINAVNDPTDSGLGAGANALDEDED